MQQLKIWKRPVEEEARGSCIYTLKSINYKYDKAWYVRFVVVGI